MDGLDAGGPLRRQLFPQSEVQAHVQEGVRAALLDGEAVVQGVGRPEQCVVFRMQFDDVRDRRVERLQRQAFDAALPGRVVTPPQFVPVAAGEEHQGRSPTVLGR